MTLDTIEAALLAWFGTGSFIGAVALLIATIASYFIARWLLGRVATAALQRTRTKFDDILVERGVFRQLAYLAPAIVAYYGLDYFPGIGDIATRLLLAYVVVNLVLIIDKLLSVGLDIYQRRPGSARRPIKSYVQLIKLLVYIVGGVLAVCALLDESPWGILTGIGAMTAVLLLIFRDTILSVIASIQIAANDMVHRGDWIEAPFAGADGDVIDVALHTVKVQNWDKTIVTFPTYKLISESFKNWRGMSESGGRRIKRSLIIDQNSIKFCDDEMIARFQTINRLKPYLDGKLQELADANGPGDDNPLNRRTLTNLGTFRAYIGAYLKENQKIHERMTFLVRQLAPSPDGIPIEIYVFTNDIDWVNYEGIQGDIFDHLLAALPFFELRIFQHPSGHDFQTITAPAASA